jgi:hypothetical protein
MAQQAAGDQNEIANEKWKIERSFLRSVQPPKRPRLIASCACLLPLPPAACRLPPVAYLATKL